MILDRVEFVQTYKATTQSSKMAIKVDDFNTVY